jgi:membrane-bound lytic murein transglycosylase D
MEKPIPMNVLKTLSLCAALWLAGCATAPSPRVTSPEPDDGIALSTSAETSKPALKPSRRNDSTAGLSLPPGRDGLMPITTQQTASRSVVALAPPADLWERIRRGYAMPDLDTDLVRDREQWYVTRPDYIFRMTERSRKYLFHIVEELELRNMPTELALLPFIESAFNPQAVSGAKAAGMWQFMPATGKYFELRQNAFRDDRRDVLASTRAALDYLQKLYGMFGDWHLALAAYNWGEGSLGRAIAKNQRAGLKTGYTDLNMPMETRFYVPKLQAVKNIVTSPAAFNSKLPLIENHPYFQTVPIRRDMDVAVAAKLAEVSLEDFKALNPSANRPVLLAAVTPQILLPWDNAEVFQSNLETYGGSRLASWTVWVAPATLRPADAAKRVGMSEAQFRAINNIPARMVIQAGSTLLVPRHDSVTHDVAEKAADTGQVSLAPEVVLKRSTVRAGKGESVASIARKYKVGTDTVAQWNKVSANATFKVGQQVVLFLPARSPVRSTAKPAPRGKAPVAKPRTTQPKKR